MYEHPSRRKHLVWVWILAGLAALGFGAVLAIGSSIVATWLGPSAVATTTEVSPQAVHPLATGIWDLVLDEDFSVERLDQETWAPCHWWDNSGCTIATNEELQWYLPGNVAISDGVLILSAIREVTDDVLVWYLDGAEVWRYDGRDVPREPMYLVANLAVGGDYAGPPDPATVFPAIFEIDFIRIWQEV